MQREHLITIVLAVIVFIAIAFTNSSASSTVDLLRITCLEEKVAALTNRVNELEKCLSQNNAPTFISAKGKENIIKIQIEKSLAELDKNLGWRPVSSVKKVQVADDGRSIKILFEKIKELDMINPEVILSHIESGVFKGFTGMGVMTFTFKVDVANCEHGA
jgi:regulatory protein YycH of two-component signal transduction system YycFG